MSLVIKPISGMLTKDMDFFGKMVRADLKVGPLLCVLHWKREEEN